MEQVQGDSLGPRGREELDGNHGETKRDVEFFSARGMVCVSRRGDDLLVRIIALEMAIRASRSVPVAWRSSPVDVAMPPP
jgi:hypothetical protein